MHCDLLVSQFVENDSENHANDVGTCPTPRHDKEVPIPAESTIVYITGRTSYHIVQMHDLQGA